MFCKYCGKQLLENADVCLKCGRFVDKEPVATHATNAKPVSKPTPMGSAYILAIISFILSLFPFLSLGSLVTSIISLCLYKKTEKKEGKGFAVAGLLISYFALALIIILIVFSNVAY